MTASAPEGAPAPELSLTDGLIQLSFLVQAVLGRLAGEQGLSITQVRMLAVLEDREIGMRRLAGILELEKSSVTGLVDRAERRGLVRRNAVPGNRRAVHVTVTEAGRAVVHLVHEAVRTELGELAGALDEGGQNSFRRSTGALIRHYVTRHAIPL
ncbi:MarR family transcriptional regulator [Amycolatopsis sp. PS_44_ISF1]|uniref:MarR family winged helix-turn-helix transcriptional regulator n=1 Tax=Amycolatopsis sp. PS_44_ISF1 TaxID=2974917 RepID=UPI0028DE3D2A|nr:MarR family transcriptional regulator [Amycolatopsis sp. PS_44_ISF1]MDT8913178.1 MarR family transcriptional regulator [Amycolatopsis sp. PS_44_ISF1]